MTVYRMIEFVGTSGTSVSDAIHGALERANASLDRMQWFEVKEIRGRVEEDGTPEFQVRVEVGHLLHAPETMRNAKGAKTTRLPARNVRSQTAQVAAKKGERRRSDLAKGFRKQR